MSLRARSRSARSRSARVTAASRSIARRRDRRRVDGSIATFQFSRSRRIEDQQAQPILRLLHRGLGDDQLFLIGGDLGLRRHEIERRRRADVHLRLVHAHQLLARASAPIAARRRWRAPRPGSSTRLFTFAVVCTRLSRSRVSAMSRLVRLVASCWRAGVDGQIAHERLRHADRQPGLQQRVVAVEEAVAVGVRGGPRRRCTMVPNHGSLCSSRRSR